MESEQKSERKEPIRVSNLGNSILRTRWIWGGLPDGAFSQIDFDIDRFQMLYNANGGVGTFGEYMAWDMRR